MQTALFLSLLAGSLALGTPPSEDLPRREITGALGLSNGMTWGDWGPKEYCPEGSFVHAFDTKYEMYSSSDETGLNAVKLFCSTPGHHDTGYITSVEGHYGDWQGMRICDSGFVTGMQGNVVPSQGIFEDDLAVIDVKLSCNYGNLTLIGVDIDNPIGIWSNEANCSPGSAVCGIEIRYEAPSVADDSGVTDIVMFCCKV